MNSQEKPIDELINSQGPWLFIIARVSDPKQIKALPAQKKRLYEYAKIRGLMFSYYEFNETAFKGKRKDFWNNVIEPIQQAKGMVYVVFDKIDRFSRDATSAERTALTTLFRKGRIEMHFPADNLFINKNSPASDLFRLDIGVALAGYYSSAIRDNVKRRFDQKLQDGEWPGKAPIGYLNYVKGHDKDGKAIKDIKLDPERYELVRQALEMRASGISYGAITTTLQKAGLTSSRKRKPIPQTQVVHFLNNSFYMGKMKRSGKVYDHNYPRLIEPWMWDKIQEVNEIRAHKRTKYKGKLFVYRDLINCATCGYTVYSDGPKKGGNIYLMCTQYGGKHGAMRINEKLINAQVLTILRSIQIPEDWVPKLVTDLQKEFESEQKYYRQNLVRLQKEYDGIDEEIKDMFRDRSTYIIKPELFDELIKEKTQRQADILEQMKDHSKGNEQFVISASKILELCSRACELFMAETTTLTQKRRLIEFVLTNLQLDGEKLRFTLKEPFNSIAECQKQILGANDGT